MLFDLDENRIETGDLSAGVENMRKRGNRPVRDLFSGASLTGRP
jgi:hypothetical protein